MRCAVGVALLAAAAVAEHPIKRVVVLMEENRSFDHMLGWMAKTNGLDESMFQRTDTKDPASEKVYVQKGSKYIGTIDPDHGVDATSEKIFGEAGVDTEGVEAMSGFVEYEMKKRGHTKEQAAELVQMFTPDQIPVMSTLAKEFCVMDRYFASVPGPTSPNRVFQLLGTSLGLSTTVSVEAPEYGMPSSQTSIFKQVTDAGLDWRFYYQDLPSEALYTTDVVAGLLTGKVKGWDKFAKDAAAGALPAFTWLNPRWFAGGGKQASDQHPDHDVREGERLMKEVYETLRASPQWNETLLIITYDEHGGFFDHVAPPTKNVPRPDAHEPKPAVGHGFEFDRLGVRIPVLLVSPWVQKGRVVSRSTKNPTPDSEFDHTSIIASVRNIFNMSAGALTPRDAWASTFDHYFDEPAPRTDCPATLPEVAGYEGWTAADFAAAYEREAARPLNHLQEEFVRGFSELRGPDSLLTQAVNLPKTQGEGSVWAHKVMPEILAGQHIFAGKEL